MSVVLAPVVGMDEFEQNADVPLGTLKPGLTKSHFMIEENYPLLDLAVEVREPILSKGMEFSFPRTARIPQAIWFSVDFDYYRQDREYPEGTMMLVRCGDGNTVKVFKFYVTCILGNDTYTNRISFRLVYPSPIL